MDKKDYFYLLTQLTIVIVILSIIIFPVFSPDERETIFFFGLFVGMIGGCFFGYELCLSKTEREKAWMK